MAQFLFCFREVFDHRLIAHRNSLNSTMAMANGNGNMAANEESDFLGSWEEMADSGVCKRYYYISF